MPTFSKLGKLLRLCAQLVLMVAQLEEEPAMERTRFQIPGSNFPPCKHKQTSGVSKLVPGLQRIML